MNILVVRNDKLGDFITSLPTIYILKKHNPQNKIFVLISPINKDIAKSCEFIDEVIIDNNQSVFSLAKVLKSKNINLSFTLFSNTRIAFAQFLACISTRVAPATKIAQIFYNKRIKQRRSEAKMSEYEYNIALIKSYFMDIDTSLKDSLIHFDDTKDVYDDFCKEYSIIKPIVAFHPGFGGSSDTNWTLDEYVVLISSILKYKDIQVVVTFGPDEDDIFHTMKDLFKKDLLKDDNIVLYKSDKGLINFAKLVSNFKLFVSTSTGTYHLAALMGVETMTFFGDSLFASVKRWKAISNEKLQHPYMLSSDILVRKEQFNIVQKDLKNIIDTKIICGQMI